MQLWHDMAMHGSNWKCVDLFEFQVDIEVSKTFHTSCLSLVWVAMATGTLTFFSPPYFLIFSFSLLSSLSPL